MTHHEKIFKYFPPFLYFIKKIAQEGERKIEAHKKIWKTHITPPFNKSMAYKNAPLNIAPIKIIYGIKY